jgi:hypothetical protein
MFGLYTKFSPPYNRKLCCLSVIVPYHPTFMQKLLSYIMIRVHSVDKIRTKDGKRYVWRFNASKVFNW